MTASYFVLPTCGETRIAAEKYKVAAACWSYEVLLDLPKTACQAENVVGN
jgi:hypothetical protein